MKRTAYIIILILSMTLIGSWHLGAQGYDELPYPERSELAKKQIGQLKKGVLIVRLPSNQNKIDALRKLIADERLEGRSRKRLEEKLEAEINQTSNYNRAVVEAFRAEYDFSEVLFMMDTATTQLTEGRRSGLFLDQALRIDPALTLEDRPFYILRFGATDEDRGQSIDAMVIADPALYDLVDPFPYYVRTNHFNAVVGGIFAGKDRQKKDLRQSVSNLNRKLKQYFIYSRKD